MKTKENKSKKKLSISFLLAILIVLALIAGLAYAKYITSLNDNVSSQIAKWNFKVVDGNTDTVDVLDFPITRTDNNPSVAEGKIAPGTSGEFRIIIDTTGTEVSLIYDVLIDLIDCPENMVFYKVLDTSQPIGENEEDTREKVYLSRFGGKLEINRYRPAENASRNIYRNNILGVAF